MRLFMGIYAADTRVYAGRFTLLKSDRLSEKALVVLLTRQLYFLTIEATTLK